MELPNKKKINQLDFLNNEIKNNDNEKPNFLNKSILSSKNNNQNQSIENIPTEKASNNKKETLMPFLYKTKEDAEKAASEYGCIGAHKMGKKWMPCKMH